MDVTANHHLTTERDVSFSHYRGAEILGVVDSVDQWDESGLLARLDRRSAHRRLHLVTAARSGLLVGYLLVDASDGLIRIVDEHLVGHADEDGRIAARLTDLAIDVAASPWGDVRVARTSLTLPHLLREGWHPVPDGSRRPEHDLTLSGAGVL